MSVAEIHPSAIVAEGARLGAGVKIGPWCSVSAQAVLEEGVELVSHAVVDGDTRIGPGTKLMPFASVGLPPQDLKYKGEPTRVEIGARCTFREHSTIHRGSVGGHGLTRIGDNCLIMACAHVGHDCTLSDNVILANNVMLGGHVEIGDTVFVGGGAAVHQFVRIGRQAVIGGMSGIEADVIPYGACLGDRARLTGLNLIGLKRRGFSRPRIHALRAAVRSLFASDGVFSERLARTRASWGEDPAVAEILAFVDTHSRRGLMRARVHGLREDEAPGEAA
ncbi:acyl-[acyl-carrier-protein]--UDP-N-acetylglucosamine O-acyltransferase [Roseomonas gilardii]|uniref:Acyl-[acyl-carrier-protein]--UDP-N-acetylglucosamine O-acyltransferase n=1 Tax=Roseomonas gilardii TaxID=257708 RepID=A0A1L7AFB2_9PROT|nr:acyl-ACP--UDP-N-acetylglucosamine O-acyltransferase [Roseomonas gilardii]APT57421.1 acyl-[acyl-carrier-protein]--UDP-N-acetylglucosamine O-acyltransferase [Roseomonas gilardii]